MLEEWDDMEENPNPDLLELLTAEPINMKKASLYYDYKPTPVPIPEEDIENK